MPAFDVLSAAALAATALFPTRTSAAPSPSQYQLVNFYIGQSFFDGWSFFTDKDPTNGFVNYTDKQTAMSAGLAGYIYNSATKENTAYMGVDHTTVNPTAGRASVRISSDQSWSQGGLFVADVRHSPQGSCGSWPALWLVGPEWPHQGEIDIIEGVNDNDYNSMTLHTGPQCRSNLPQNEFLGKLIHNDCDVTGGNNTGCSIQAENSQSYNPRSKKTVTHPTASQGFNRAGGGVYATLWDESGVEIWMFARSALPADLVAGKPDPSSWTVKPLARFGGDGCDYADSFKSQQLVIDTTFCGEWAGAPETWAKSAQCKAKAPTCQEFVAGHPEAFRETYWEIGSIQVFQTSQQQSASGTRPIAGLDGKHAEFPTTLAELLPEGEDADCADMTDSSSSASSSPSAGLTASSVAPSSTASASASANATAYSNSTDFIARHKGVRRHGGRLARMW